MTTYYLNKAGNQFLSSGYIFTGTLEEAKIYAFTVEALIGRAVNIFTSRNELVAYTTGMSRTWLRP